MSKPAWEGREAVSVWPPDEKDPMWQFRLGADGWVEVCGRDGTNWIRISPNDWDDLVFAMEWSGPPVNHVWEEKRLD